MNGSPSLAIAPTTSPSEFTAVGIKASAPSAIAVVPCVALQWNPACAATCQPVLSTYCSVSTPTACPFALKDLNSVFSTQVQMPQMSGRETRPCPIDVTTPCAMTKAPPGGAFVAARAVLTKSAGSTRPVNRYPLPAIRR